jgi:hypothetical protein
MRSTRTSSPGQLALWGRYELEDQADAHANRRQAQTEPAPAIPAPVQQAAVIPAPRVELTPVFLAPVHLAPVFQAPATTTDGPSAHTPVRSQGAVVIVFQAVHRPSSVGRSRAAMRTIESSKPWETADSRSKGELAFGQVRDHPDLRGHEPDRAGGHVEGAARPLDRLVVALEVRGFGDLGPPGRIGCRPWIKRSDFTVRM